jgi:hypothetical protein
MVLLNRTRFDSFCDEMKWKLKKKKKKKNRREKYTVELNSPQCL